MKEKPKEEQKVIKQAETSVLTCSTCEITFECKDDFKTHYKSEMHIENSKWKSRGKPIFNEEEFLKWREEMVDQEMFGSKRKGKKGKRWHGDDDD